MEEPEYNEHELAHAAWSYRVFLSPSERGTFEHDKTSALAIQNFSNASGWADMTDTDFAKKLRPMLAPFAAMCNRLETEPEQVRAMAEAHAKAMAENQQQRLPYVPDCGEDSF